MNEVLHQLNPNLGKERFHVIGRAFLGVMHKDKKSQSYTSTLWLVFCYLPILPYNTYRVFSDEGRTRVLPRVFALDEFILYRSVKIDFSWRQVLMTLLTVWGGLGALAIVSIFTYLEFGSVALLELLLGVVIAALALLLVQDLMNLRFNRRSKAAAEAAVHASAPKISAPEASISKEEPKVEPHLPEIIQPSVQLERSAPTPTVATEVAIEPAEKIMKEESIQLPPPVIEPPVVTPVSQEPVPPAPVSVPPPLPVKSTITVDLEAEQKPQKALDLESITGAGGLPRKFDPDKVLMPATMVDLEFIEDMKYYTPAYRTAGVLAIINMIVLGADIMLDLYFTLEPQAGFPLGVQKVYLLVSKYHLFDFTGIVLAIIMFLSRHFIVPYVLALLAIISLLGMHIEIFNYFKVQ